MLIAMKKKPHNNQVKAGMQEAKQRTRNASSFKRNACEQKSSGVESG